MKAKRKRKPYKLAKCFGDEFIFKIWKERYRSENKKYLYSHRCPRKETLKIEKENDLVTEPKKKKKRVERKPAPYPMFDKSNVGVKTFQLFYDQDLSVETKLVLNTFQKKYLYHAIDDILYSFKFNLTEKDNLLGLLYSPVLSLQNDLCIDFFNIWIAELCIYKLSKSNRFLCTNCHNSYRIKMKLVYKIKEPPQTQKFLW